MKKRMTIMLIALFIVFGGLIGFNMFKAYMIKRYFATYEPPAVTVSSVEAKTINWHPEIDAVGNFLAINGVDVNAEVSGNVVKIHFNSGEYVKKGEPLIDIDDSVEQATLKFNRAELTLKEISFKRQSDLYKRGATPSSSVDEARANLEQAQANVEKTQAEINQKHIKAPFTGRLGIRQVNLGQFINPGQTMIVSLQSMDPLYLEFYLPEQLFKKIHINQPISFAVDGFSGMQFKGKITAINSKVDPNTHNILVQATVPNCPASAFNAIEQSSLIKIETEENSRLKTVVCNSELNDKNNVDQFIFLPGMFASIDVSQPPVPNTVVLPSTAISYSLYGNSVFVIEKGKKDKQGKDILTVRRVFVSTGEQRGNYTVIKKGIKAGQLVVSSGELKLQNGTRVTINNDVKLEDIKDPDKLGQ
ncbi:efflux RND transporter periplasmic adaptor subunit [Legionella israelensis]|uniref:RND efflux membrane fusion protein, acriflavin resistance protein E n=1 Tax=Legionella israelensis TaxID=454 RepID=A0A0W0WI82_9GAMM|nr:efflux RND transporter periplasmic adaptor subunit [Legionella israelensis]KTD32049.1 RND efflux membrane fusion protein, acriflavin resistance protein E [Legionella israelensis]QBS09092.1 efflux RND transporter periplasmic adaptor subunit [Legionella israelensis]QDP72068.1 efflux RND transporter periplasmic adaptor subunit [Legionella israelensis]SCY08991.1 membrane fusion protein, multidrug efflux system [Legionella israelensis DSM 19235]STX58811.1 RND efflux membrane fusion protein, acri